MPELPEVETICRKLRDGTENRPGMLGWVVQRGEVYWPRTLAVPSLTEFYARMPGQVIREVSRRGKYLIFNFPSEALLIHLRMSGDLWVEAGDAETTLGDLGPEPLEQDFTAQMLYERLQVTRRQLKPLLLDQTFLAGLGNIYVDESLHMAGLHPLTPSNRVSEKQAERLLENIRTVLLEGIRRNGASIDWVYRGGEFQNYFRVYQRTGEPCPVCGTPVERLVIGQRGTHFCPSCQVKLN